MKRILVLLLHVLFVAQGCSTFNGEDILLEEDLENINLPKASEEYGKLVAIEIKEVVNNLNKKSYDFPKLKNMDQARTFYKVAHNAAASPKLKSSNSDPLNINENDDWKKELTNAQNEIVFKIIASYKGTKTDKEFKSELISISREIAENIPHIEQERLFNMIAVLYFGLTEIQYLEQQGAISREDISVSTSNYPRLRSLSEGDDWNGPGDGEKCRKEVSAMTYVLGTINSLGEKLTNVTSTAIGMAGAFILTWCVQRELDTMKECAKWYSKCQDSGNPKWVGKNSSGTYGTSKCAQCLLDCQREGAWPCGFSFY